MTDHDGDRRARAVSDEARFQLAAIAEASADAIVGRDLSGVVTAWNKAAANEYGFYSNVNPNVDHPRWSQTTERRIGEDGLFAKRRKTLMFNGYEAQVGQLYAGMDLKKNF